MKRGIIMKTVVQLLLVITLFTFASTASAIPSLQLDISDGVYDTTTETVVATTAMFDLYALIDMDLLDVGDTFYISAALSPQVEEGIQDLGSFVFGVETVDVTKDMIYGTPPADSTLKDISPHSIFPTYYKEFEFTLDPASFSIVPAYNVEPGDSDPDADGLATGDDMYLVPFAVDVSGLSVDYIIHFDLYTFVDGHLKTAPYSHDAESAPVPEPSTLLLLGAGIAGLAIYRRKKS